MLMKILNKFSIYKKKVVKPALSYNLSSELFDITQYGDNSIKWLKQPFQCVYQILEGYVHLRFVLVLE